LLGLLLFSWFGYRLWVDRAEAKVNTALEIQLDNNQYNESQLLLIKIPVSHLSYYGSSKEFERVDGQVEMHGIQYKFVKRRLYNDSIELYCIPNQVATVLQQVKNDFFKSICDIQTNGSNKKNSSHPNTFKSFSTDDYTMNNASAFVIPSSILLTGKFTYAESLTSLYQFTAEHPPDVYI
jgi:hypothetical protein